MDIFWLNLNSLIHTFAQSGEHFTDKKCTLPFVNCMCNSKSSAQFRRINFRFHSRPSDDKFHSRVCIENISFIIFHIEVATRELPHSYLVFYCSYSHLITLNKFEFFCRPKALVLSISPATFTSCTLSTRECVSEFHLHRIYFEFARKKWITYVQPVARRQPVKATAKIFIHHLIIFISHCTSCVACATNTACSGMHHIKTHEQSE